MGSGRKVLVGFWMVWVAEALLLCADTLLSCVPNLAPAACRPLLATLPQGSVLASDAFFPFSWNDSVEIACQAGVAAIVHPGGSVRDADAIECCNKYGVVLLTTGVRHFKH